MEFFYFKVQRKGKEEGKLENVKLNLSGNIFDSFIEHICSLMNEQPDQTVLVDKSNIFVLRETDRKWIGKPNIEDYCIKALEPSTEQNPLYVYVDTEFEEYERQVLLHTLIVMLHRENKKKIGKLNQEIFDYRQKVNLRCLLLLFKDSLLTSESGEMIEYITEKNLKLANLSASNKKTVMIILKKLEEVLKQYQLPSDEILTGLLGKIGVTPTTPNSESGTFKAADFIFLVQLLSHIYIDTSGILLNTLKRDAEVRAIYPIDLEVEEVTKNNLAKLIELYSKSKRCGILFF